MGDYSTGVRMPSKGQVDYATVAGSLGLASFAGINLGNLFGGNGCGTNGGGLFAGNRNCGGCTTGFDSCETKEAALLREQVATLRAENFSRMAATQAFTDSVTYSSNQHDKQAANIEKLFDVVIVNGNNIEKLNGKIDCQYALMQKDMEIMRKDIAIEADKRCCGDNSIVTYSNATFYPKQVANVTVGTTSVPQPTYNPLPNCNPCCGR